MMTGADYVPVAVDLRGARALVTGAAGGLGAAIARRLGRAGASLFLTDRVPCTTLAAELRADGVTLSEQAADMGDAAAIRALVATAVDTLGGIDILITAAGVTSAGGFESIDEAEWDRVHDINLKGVFLTCRAVLPHMKALGRGRIVNIGSVLAKNGGNPRPWLDPDEQKGAANAAYAASKAGVHALTLCLAKEVASFGITANAIAPGPIESAMTAAFPAALKAQIPLGRLGRADEVAALASFLCSREAAFITGEIIDVNGGLWPD